MARQVNTKSRDKIKSIDVIFVSDDALGDIIVSRKEYERVQQRKLKVQRAKENEEESPGPTKLKRRKEVDAPSIANKTGDDLELQLAALENFEVEKENLVEPTTLFEDDDIRGTAVQNFEKRKTANSVMSAVPKTPSSDTSKSYALRKRDISDISEIQKILENSEDEKDFSGSESEYASESESSSDGSDVEDEKEGQGILKKRCSRLALHNSLLTGDTRSIKVEVPSDHKKHKAKQSELVNSYLSLFPKWDFLLRQNYNIIMYGVGSKKEIIDKFLSSCAGSNPVIRVNGFFPTITAKDIVDKLCECLKLNVSSADALSHIEAKLNGYATNVYVGINNIDGTMLRSHKSQHSLRRLALLPQVRMLATVDHVNAPLLWDHCLLMDFNWIWIDVTTLLPYSDETLYHGSLLLQPSGQLTLTSLRSVYAALTRNARELFLVLCRAQVAFGKGWAGMSFRELYKEGRHKLLVSGDAALRLQLKEFIDHSVVKVKRSPEGEELFLITLEHSILNQFLEDQNIVS